MSTKWMFLLIWTAVSALPLAAQGARQSSGSSASAADDHSAVAVRSARDDETKRHEQQRKPGQVSAIHASGHPRLAKVNHPRQLHSRRRPMMAGSTGSGRQSPVILSNGVRQGPSVANQTARGELPSRRMSAARLTVSPAQNVPHRRANPAMVSGSLISHASHTGAINGTGMIRKR